MIECVVFWQRMRTPHMTELALEVARLGVEVHYVAEEELSEGRRAMGWTSDSVDGVDVHIVTTPAAARDLVDRLPTDAVHITQGVRANGLVADAQKRIMAAGLRHYPIMEKVDLRGRARWIKPLVYAIRFRRFAGRIDGFLAIGGGTRDWVESWGPKSLRVSPFAYFLKPARSVPSSRPMAANGPRFLFVGGLIARKRGDLLIEALSGLAGRPFELEIVGDGPERALWGAQAEETLPGRVRFRGTLEMDAVLARISAADCLVLPSDHDGWGAVVSEALINGTPAICSSECGAAEVVHASGVGRVFAAGDVAGLRRSLADMLDCGPVTPAARKALSDWAQCLTAAAGARYLLDTLAARSEATDTVRPPWESGRR